MARLRLLKIISLGLAFVSCGLETPSRLQEQTFQVDGQAAENLITALFQAGLRDPSGRLGALRLSADEIACSAATCLIVTKGSNLTLEPPLSTQLHDSLRQIILDQNSLIHVKKLLCSRTTTRNATVSCSFEQ